MTHVVIIDAHEIVRAGLKSIFSCTDDINVVGEAQSPHEGLSILRSASVDIAITELFSTNRGNVDFVRQAKEHDPAMQVLILAAQGGADVARRALRAGASGFLTKDAAASQIILAVRRLAKGHVFVSNEIAEKLISKYQEIDRTQGHDSLTERELEVFIRIARGETCTGIGRALSLSPKTISTHRSRILEKMHVASTADIVQYAIAHKLIPVLVA